MFIKLPFLSKQSLNKKDKDLNKNEKHNMFVFD